MLVLCGWRWSLNRESGVSCCRQRATLLSWCWSGVRSSTEAPELRRVETSLSSFVCSRRWRYQPARWCRTVQCSHWGLWADQGLKVDGCRRIQRDLIQFQQVHSLNIKPVKKTDEATPCRTHADCAPGQMGVRQLGLSAVSHVTCVCFFMMFSWEIQEVWWRKVHHDKFDRVLINKLCVSSVSWGKLWHELQFTVCFSSSCLHVQDFSCWFVKLCPVCDVPAGLKHSDETFLWMKTHFSLLFHVRQRYRFVQVRAEWSDPDTLVPMETFVLRRSDFKGSILTIWNASIKRKTQVA